MKKFTRSLTFLFAFIIQNVYAQNSSFVISTDFDGRQEILLPDLVNFSITSFSSLPVDGRIEIKMTDLLKNISIVQLESKNIQLKNGINIFSLYDFTPRYFPNNKSQALHSGIAIIDGSYEICISFIASQGEVNVKECTRLKLSSEFFIHLFDPEDRAEIETLTPILQWYTSMPDDGLSYQVLLTPLAPFKKAEEALPVNLKYLDMRVNEKFLTYPLNAIPLEYGKTYAWQVMAIKDGRVAGISEAWIFKPVEKKINEKIEADCYRIIARELNNGNYIYGNILKFAYKNTTREKILNYTVKDISSGAFLKNVPLLELKPGLNKIDLDLKELDGIIKGHQYEVQIRNTDNELYRLTFNSSKDRKMRN